MNETTRERNDLQSRGTTARPDRPGSERPNIELETTTTTIEQGRSTSGSVSDKAKAEARDTRDRAEHVGDQVRRTAAETGEQVRRRTRETAEVVRQQAAEQAAMLKDQAVAQANGRKNDLATKICDVSHALKRASDDLNEHDDSQLAAQTRTLADRVESIGNHLRESEITELLEDVEHFVRRNPTLALGGLFVVGLSVARFLKAKPPRYERPQTRPSSGSLQYGQVHQYGQVRPVGSPTANESNPYQQRQVGSTPRPSQANDMGAGTSNLAVGATNPASGTPPIGSRPANLSASQGVTSSQSAASQSAVGPQSTTGTQSTPGAKPSSPSMGSAGACSTNPSTANKPDASGQSDRGSAPRPR